MTPEKFKQIFENILDNREDYLNNVKADIPSCQKEYTNLTFKTSDEEFANLIKEQINTSTAYSDFYEFITTGDQQHGYTYQISEKNTRIKDANSEDAKFHDAKEIRLFLNLINTAGAYKGLVDIKEFNNYNKEIEEKFQPEKIGVVKKIINKIKQAY